MSDQKYEFYHPAFFANPYPTYAQMRQNDPIIRQVGADGQTELWFVTGYSEIEQILRDDQHFMRNPQNALTPEALAQQPPMSEAFKFINNHMLNHDGGTHRRLRSLVSKAFTPRRVEGMRGRIQEIADDLLDAVQAQGQMDLLDSYASPLPIIVIAELLGVPIEDQLKFRRWSDAAVDPNLNATLDSNVDEESHQRFMLLMAEFVQYLHALFEQRRQAPRDDLVTALLQVEEAGDGLNTSELLSLTALLIVAGYETTVGLIANSAYTLLRYPAEMATLKNHPERMPTAIEEFLRYESPVARALRRWVAKDVEINGHLFRRDDTVILILGSANRDETQFEMSEQLDLGRDPNPHLTFGRGVHYCLGAPLARIEGEIALNTLLRRLPDLQLAVPPEEVQWQPKPGLRKPQALPVTWRTT